MQTFQNQKIKYPHFFFSINKTGTQENHSIHRSWYSMLVEARMQNTNLNHPLFKRSLINN